MTVRRKINYSAGNQKVRRSLVLFLFTYEYFTFVHRTNPYLLRIHNANVRATDADAKETGESIVYSDVYLD